MDKVVELKLTDIFVDNEMNCRGSISPIDVIDLVRDIERDGLISPVVVQPYTGEYKYRLIAGYRRFKAHEILKWKTIRALINPNMDESYVRILNLRENINRKDLNILQEALAIEKLLTLGMSIKEVAAQFSRQPPWVGVRMALLTLPIAIQKEAEVGILNQDAINQICKLKTPEQQYEATRQIKKAKEVGCRPPRILKKKTEKPNIKRRRGRPETFKMMGHIQRAIGNNFGTRCLAWCAGEVSDEVIFKEIAASAEKMERVYVMPTTSIDTKE